MRRWIQAASLSWRHSVHQCISRRLCSSHMEDKQTHVSSAIDETDDVIEEYFDEFEMTESIEEDPNEIFRRSIPIPLMRGKRGVFEVHELTTLLRHEGVKDICVLKIPEEAHFADYMVIGSCRNQRQNRSIAEVVRRVYKEKRNDDDLVPDRPDWKKTSSDWISTDFGNIMLHLLLPSTREFYDLESLWACGEQFDSQLNVAAKREDQWNVFNWEKLAEEMKTMNDAKESVD